MNARDKKVRNIGICLLVFSLILGVTLAAPHIITATQWQQNPTCTDMLVCKTEPFFNGGSGVLISNGTVNLFSKDAFYVNNPVYYEIKMTDDVGVKKMYYLITTTRESMNFYRNMTANQLDTYSKFGTGLVELYKTGNNYFYREGYVSYPDTNPIYLVGLYVMNNTDVNYFGYLDTGITLDTQKDGSDELQSHAVRISNETVLGLTYLGLALAPALLGSDMILRATFEGEKTNENKKPTSEDTHSKVPESSQV